MVAAAAFGAAAAYLLYESQWLRRVDHRLEIDDLPTELEGFRVVQLSDLHLGSPGFNLRVFGKAIALANAARPDLIVITGDLVTGARRLAELYAGVARLQAAHGVLAVLGNHDHGYAKLIPTPEVDLTALADHGVRLLVNECVSLPVGAGAVLQVCGIDDYRHEMADLTAVEAALDRRPGVVRLLLSHYAEAALATTPGDYAITLAGDTHGGQICVPWPGGKIMLSDPRARFRAGFYDAAGRRIFVTRGVGTSFLPFRFLCRPEVVVHTLQRAR